MITRGVVLGGLALVLAGPAHAAGTPQAAAGIVSEHCVGCHEVPGYQAKYGRTDVPAPPFQTMADRPWIYTPEQLRLFLRQPHWPMTKFILSPSDIDNLIAFIESLRKP